MNQIPDEIKKIATSKELSDNTQKIGDEFSLHIDQIGELGAEIRDIMYGTRKSSDFIDDIIKRLEIEKSIANQIAEKVNAEIFATIKSNMQVSTDSTSVSDLEKLGGFNIEKPGMDTPKQVFGTQAMNELKQGNISESKDDILSGIENPTPIQPTVSAKQITPPINLPTEQPLIPKKDVQPNIDAMVDHLLGNPVVAVEQKVERVEVPASPVSVPVQTPKRKLPDSYREPIE